MQEGKRQKQVGGLIQVEINAIFQKLGLAFISGSMVSVSSVKITPDLLEARIYLSIFNSSEAGKLSRQEVLAKIEERNWEIKKALSAEIKHQLRRIPVLKYFLDDTLDQVFKMEELFKQIKKDEENKEAGSEPPLNETP